MPDANASFPHFLPALALRATITTYYVLEIGGDGLVEALLFPEWANIRLLLDGGWSQTFGDGRTVTHSPPMALTYFGTNPKVLLRCSASSTPTPPI